MALLLLNAAVILTVVVVLHWYLYRRLVKDVSRDGGPWRRAGTVLMVLFPVGTIGALITSPNGEPLPALRIFGWPGYVWLVLLVYLAVALAVGELVRPLLRRRLARRTAESAENTDSSRRLFVARTVAVGATVVATPLTYASAMVERTRPLPGRATEVSLPFTGLWLTRNSPARRVPSHGTDMFGGAYAIDFIGVDEQHRTAPSYSWRTFLGTEPPDLFHAFGRRILAPASGTVVAVHDGEPDHEARRSQIALVPYALTQGQRLREGLHAIAGNYVLIELEGGAFVALAHFRSGSIRVSPGERVREGQHIGDCGNSGNSTQPHVHMQVQDSANFSIARGVPMVFRRFREWPSARREGPVRERAIPGENMVVEPLPVRS